MNSPTAKQGFLKNWSYTWVLFPILAIILVFFLDSSTPGVNMNSFGIHSRHTSGLLGIFFAPFLHSNFRHLLGNIVPLFVMLNILVLFYKKSYWAILFLNVSMGGLATWVFGSDGLHIGASGLVFSLTSFFAISGFIRKKIMLMVIGVVVAYSYKSLLGGLLGFGNGLDNISYSSHWGGLIAGIITAFIILKFEQPRPNPNAKPLPPNTTSPPSDFS